jgi:hypothetical protein
MKHKTVTQLGRDRCSALIRVPLHAFQLTNKSLFCLFIFLAQAAILAAHDVINGEPERQKTSPTI